MEISVTGRHLDVGDALKAHITDRLRAAAEKYFQQAVEALVTVTKESHLFLVDCRFHIGQGISLHSHGKNDDVYAAFEMAADRAEKQLRKYKERIKSHHGFRRKNEFPALPAQAYVLAREEEPADSDGETGDLSLADPIIIAEAKAEIPHVSVGDAVMLMELAETQILMFRDIKNGRMSVVYHRPDGHIGWIQPADNEEGGGLRGRN